MKVAILTMFTGLSTTYSLVNVVADQIKMLLQAQISVKVLVSETCPDRERTGIFQDQRIQWVKIVNTRNGQPITWHDYSGASGKVHETFFEEAPRLNPKMAEVRGVVCGVRVEDIADPLMRKIRCLDKLIDELAKGKAMEKILRCAKTAGKKD